MQRRRSAPEGLYLTAALGMLFALLFNLDGIASIAGAVFMVVYLFVLVSHLRLVGVVGGHRTVIGLASAAVGLVFVLLMRRQWQTDRSAFYATCGTLAGSVLREAVYRRINKRALVPRE